MNSSQYHFLSFFTIVIVRLISHHNTMKKSQLLKKKKGDELNWCLMLLKFDLSNWCTDICKTIFVILEVQFHHEGGPIQRRYLELFFSAWSIFSPCQKSAWDEAPFKLFWTLTMILAIFAFWKSYEIFWLQNMGHSGLTKCKISVFVGLMNEK